MKTLYLIRGLPGTGKSSLARLLLAANDCISANEVSINDYFYDGAGNYKFDTTKLKEAHDCCLDQTDSWMRQGLEVICVTNPFIKLEHLVPYEQLAAKHGYQVNVLTCHTFMGNDHDVPLSTLRKMRSQMEVPTTLLPTS